MNIFKLLGEKKGVEVWQEFWNLELWEVTNECKKCKEGLGMRTKERNYGQIGCLLLVCL